jgi:hypothetical protein
MQSAHRRLDEARQRREDMVKARTVASLAAEDAANAERQARERFALSVEAEDVSRQSLAQAQTFEEEARRARVEAELVHQRTTEDLTSALRGVESTGHILTVVNEALGDADGNLRSAEQEEQAAEKALAALSQQDSSTPEYTKSGYKTSKNGFKPSDNQKATPRNSSVDPPTEDSEAYEKKRQAALAQSIRKMDEMRRQEELDAAQCKREELSAREQQRQAHLRAAEAEARADHERREREREEQQRREREETERKEQEEAVRWEKERLDAIRREQAWKAATKREIIRCSTRDLERWPRNRRWTAQDALDRFQLLSDEFDTLKFSNDTPLTVTSVPWPVLCVPYDLIIKIHIEWKAVESFFLIVKTMLTPSQFGALLEKSQRRFHPDRWRSRGLLATVIHEPLKEALETAVNAVSQATNELLSNWRDRKIT